MKNDLAPSAGTLTESDAEKDAAAKAPGPDSSGRADNGAAAVSVEAEGFASADANDGTPDDAKPADPNVDAKPADPNVDAKPADANDDAPADAKDDAVGDPTFDATASETGHEAAESAKVRGAGAVAFASYVLGQLLRLGSNLILTRILPQTVFGTMALIQPWIIGLHLFSDTGVNLAIVQNKDGEKQEFLDTAFTIQAWRGLGLWVACCAIAYPVAQFYGYPQFVYLMPFIGLSTLITGLESTRLALLQRHLNMRMNAYIRIGTQALQLAITLVLAYITQSIWAIIVGTLISDIFLVVVSHTVLGGPRHRFRIDSGVMSEIVHFGRWIFLSTALNFFVTQGDRLVLGALISLEELAIYQVALVLASMPSIALSQVGNVLMPAYSRVIQRKGELPRADFLHTRGQLLVLAAWVISGFVGGGPVMVDLLWEEEYSGAGWMVQMLALGSFFAVIDTTNTPALMAMGRPKWLAASNVGKLVGMVILIPIGFHLWGFAGAVGGYAGTEVFRWVVSSAGAIDAKLNPLAQDTRMLAYVGVGSALGWFAAQFAKTLTNIAAIHALFVFVAVTALFIPVVWPALQQLRQERAARAV